MADVPQLVGWVGRQRSVSGHELDGGASTEHVEANPLRQSTRHPHRQRRSDPGVPAAARPRSTSRLSSASESSAAFGARATSARSSAPGPLSALGSFGYSGARRTSSGKLSERRHRVDAVLPQRQTGRPIGNDKGELPATSGTADAQHQGRDASQELDPATSDDAVRTGSASGYPCSCNTANGHVGKTAAHYHL